MAVVRHLIANGTGNRNRNYTSIILSLIHPLQNLCQRQFKGGCISINILRGFQKRAYALTYNLCIP